MTVRKKKQTIISFIDLYKTDKGIQMAKSHNQKAKILILEHLLAGTSRDQIVTMQEILDRLAEYDITAERKSMARSFLASLSSVMS